MPAPLRRFIDWSKPLLKETVDFLLTKDGSKTASKSNAADTHPHTSAHTLDLSHLTILLPTGRAGRRLIEMLVQACPAGRVLTPPKVTTPGQLPELLYKPALPVAEPIIARLARARALATLPQEHLKKIIPHPPDADMTVQWLRLAADFENLAAELAAENLLTADSGQAQSRLHQQGMLGFDDHERWQALALAEAAYRDELSKLGLLDPHQARQQALEKNDITLQGQLLIVAAPALSKLVTAMISRIAHQTQVIIHAPESLAELFDDTGNINVQAWAQRQITLEDSQLKFVNRPQDQAQEVVRLLAEDYPAVDAASSASAASTAASPATSTVTSPAPASAFKAQAPVKPGPRPINTDQLTIGLGDGNQAKPIARALELTGLRGRIAQGEPIRAGRVCVLLEILSNFIRDQRTSDLALLARQPDMEAWLRLQGINDQTPAPTRKSPAPNEPAQDGQTLDEPAADEPTPAAKKNTGQVVPFLACLDQAITRHLPLEASSTWPGDSAPDTTAKNIVSLINEKLLPEKVSQTRRADGWVNDFLGTLSRLYGHRTLYNHNPKDETIIRALTALREACAQIAFCDSAQPLLPQVDFSGFIGLILSGITQAVPSPSMPGSIELLGWLELHLDDASHLIITSFNEGFIPESINHDPVLPGTLRAALKVGDNQSRFARDTYALSAILASRPWVRIIACRRSSDDRPMTPSRLLVKHPDTLTVARRLRAFSDHNHTEPTDKLIIAAGGLSLFVPPLPVVTASRQVFRVTELADFIRCPYRYYLKHIQKVKAQDDQAREMDTLSFGNLVHDVLKEFGTSDLTASTDPEQIKSFLFQTLAHKAIGLLGSHPPAPALIQLKLIENRLANFASKQAEETLAGWQIVKQLTESEISTTIDVDGEPVKIVGTIDRVDYSTVKGYRVLDYKTGNPRSAQDCFQPDAQGSYRWSDYQLPLYHHLLSDYLQKNNPVQTAQNPGIATGYFNLPHKSSETGIDFTQWEPQQLAVAMDETRSIIRLVRAQNFWPPASPPGYDDGLSALCHDNDIAREDVIANLTKAIAQSKTRAGGGIGA